LFFLQWPIYFSRRREGKEGGREKVLVGAPLHAAGKHASHHHDKGGEAHRMSPRTATFGTMWALLAPAAF